MYTVLKNTQIVIALLKEYGIKHIVISPGTRNGPFVHSLEEDDYFKCYSVVDERSAAFFALGIARQLREPVVISCTSSTAACNYFSAVTEAYYSHIPLVVLTSDRSPYTRGQLEKQQIEQVGMYGKMCRVSVDLPLEIHDDDEFWYCERLVNEALMELSHHEGGPVQINMPAYYNLEYFTESKLPLVKRIYRNSLRSPYSEHESRLADLLHTTGKIMVMCGAHAPWTSDMQEKLRRFLNIYNCALVGQHMSNLNMSEMIPITAGTDICNCLVGHEPDILISIGGPTQMMYFEKLRKSKVKHWLVNEDGDIEDPTRHLTDIFECPLETFFDYFISHVHADWVGSGEYQAEVSTAVNQYTTSRPELDVFSNIYVIREFCKLVPSGAIVNMSILNAIRIVETFPLAENVEVYANVGAYGIDGCMSTFMGQASVAMGPAYHVTGDLSFLYDMNSIWIRHVGDNVHILLINNYEGIEMRRSYRNHGDVRRYITAGHHVSPKGWIEDNGFHYYTATSKSELAEVMPTFVNDNKKCVLEVFTSGIDDDKEAFNYYSLQNTSMNGVLKSKVKSVLGDEGVYKLKKIIGRK
ncbi:2-succinyl-5-enolpyruvyl-6-hydroxy-3-cyclohexene-1-carboxylic-acid synthase [Blautia liquoris]|uniref:2-succinyl-5-enolpyruvyl-6-hydroxy-3-cyclohexene-1-carboxylic-acid synthase n=1 Tax=Blautia liquoris TaxID=2779518 RepID=A0A7M2RF40_9FIRM|nr:2-succinyl-5-enolpyruvyl-6-hydroxy-3-cyclohexene-1-carboxylic-acid synthase [Blautia liquoris]QOV18869.1 2-succinyl-5-enolpyruvyl-6-hydroxy-3-cyclohexene-1-carboxylic-acid synthase [Blautia liquoris]